MSEPLYVRAHQLFDAIEVLREAFHCVACAEDSRCSKHPDASDNVDRALKAVGGFAPILDALRRHDEAVAILRQFRNLPHIPPGPGGSTVPWVRSLRDVEQRADALLAAAPVEGATT